MNPTTAVGFLLTGFSLAMVSQRKSRVHPVVLWAARASALVVSGIGLVKGIAILGGPDLAMDQYLFRSLHGQTAGSDSAMAPNTALNFILVGNALLLLHSGKRRASPLACIAALVCGFEALLVVLGYLYGLSAFYGLHTFIPMALPTAVAFLIVTFGIMACQANRGFLAVITGQNVGGVMARRLLPAAILVPAVIGWLRLKGQHYGLFDSEFGTALYTVTNMLVFGCVVAGNGYLLFKSDARRVKADKQLRTAHLELQRQIERQSQANTKLEAIANLQQEVATASADLPAIMTLIAERVQNLTGADGAVVQLIEGEELVSRGCSGSMARQPGTRRPLTSDFTGQCIREAKTLLCEDSETDDRVDRPACRRIGARSMLAAPLNAGGEIVGVLNVLSSSPAAFDNQDLSALQAMAGLLGSVIYRKRADEQLRHHTSVLSESEERYRLLFETNPYPVWVYDLETLAFLAVNQAAIQHYGFSREEFLSMTLKDIRPADRVPALLHDVAQAADAPKTTGTWQHRTKAGSVIDVEITARPISFGDRKARLVLVNDITDRLRNENALEKAKEDADEANRAKSEFLSRMSHELRTPMNAILGFAQLLELENLTVDQQESVRYIVRSGQHLLELINEVLDISRIEAGRLTLSTEPVELSDALRETIEMVRTIAADREITITCPPASEHYILADRQRLKQVLINLVSNAIKYNRIGGSVGISCQNIDSHIRINVRDTGMGIPADKLSRLFTPFERLGAEQGTVEGTGLGLAVSKRLVDAMNGVIGVDSIPSEGTTFWLEFPATASPLSTAEIPDATVATPAVNGEGKRRVLYIEDNLSNLRLIERVLEHRPSVELLSAPDGSKGLEVAHGSVPNLILLDLNLPDMHGHEVLTRLKNDPRCNTIPVVAISADATSVQKERMLRAGAKEYLTKPLNIKKFLDVLDRSLVGAESEI